MKKIKIFREGDRLVLQDVEILPPEFVKRSKKEYHMVFVGMHSIRTKKDVTVIYSLPKYFPKEKCTLEHLDEIKRHIKKICNVVELLKNDGKEFEDGDVLFNPYEQNKKRIPVNRVELAEYIIEDYIQNGLYVKELFETKKGGSGRISWTKTVAKMRPILQKDEIVYPEQIKKNHMVDENNLMSVLHANVLNQCLDYIGSLISDGIVPVETEYLGEDLSSYAGTINAYSTYIFKEQEINLFKALEAWCKESRFYEPYAGVTCFDRVWEWVNDAVWRSDKAIKTSNPMYYLGDNEYIGAGEAIPDTIRIQDNRVYIFDSKYYVVRKIDRNKLYKFPANSDIVKQVAYLRLMKNRLKAEKFINVFLMPECTENCGEDKALFSVPEEEWFKCIGYAEQGQFNLPDKYNHMKISTVVENENEVLIVMENPDKLYDRYLRKNDIIPEDLAKISCKVKFS